MCGGWSFSIMLMIIADSRIEPLLLAKYKQTTGNDPEAEEISNGASRKSCMLVYIYLSPRMIHSRLRLYEENRDKQFAEATAR